MNVTIRDIAEVFILLERLLLCPVPRQVADDPIAAAEAWSLLLCDLTRDELRGAAVAYARSGPRFWPNAGQLLALVPRLAPPTQADVDGDWGELLRLVGRYGYMNPPVEDAAAAREAGWREHDWRIARRIEPGIKALGGWRMVCRLEDDDMGPARASFRAVMLSALTQANNAKLLGAGPGLRLLEGGAR